MFMGSFQSPVIFRILTLLLLDSCYSVAGTVTQSPSFACAGESITVSCVLTVPNAGAGDDFDSDRTSFILGPTNLIIPESTLIGTGTANGFDLARFTAATNAGNDTEVSGLITLLSYINNTDEGLRMGCGSDYRAGGAGSPIQLTEALTLVQAVPLQFYQINLEHSLTNFDTVACTATVNLTWTHPNQPANSPLTVEQYFLFLNGTMIATVIPPLSSYSYNTSLQLNTPYIYSITGTNCAGNTSDGTILFIPASPNPPPPTPIMVLDTLKITPDMSTTRISQALQYTIKLIKSDLNTNNQTVDTIQDYSEMFDGDFSLDTCYFTETTVKTCAIESSPTISRKYIIYNLENITINQCLSYEWVSGPVTLDVTEYIINDISCSDEDYDTQFLADGLLSAMLIKRNDPTFLMNITNITLIPPFRYNFTFVGKIVCEEVIFLEMYFNGIKMPNFEVPFCCPITVPDEPTLTTILICILILLLILLLIVILLIVIFILIRKKKREGKKWCLLLCWKKCSCHCGKKCSCHCGKKCSICEKNCPCLCEEKCPCL